MPELPEVETIVAGLAPCLIGRRIEKVFVHRAGLRRHFPPDLAHVLTGASVTALARRGKFGIIHTDRGKSLIFHLGMSGRWRIDAVSDEPCFGAQTAASTPGTHRHDHLVLQFAGQEGGAGRAGKPIFRLALNDARRFGSVDLIATDEMDLLPCLTGLGPEPVILGEDGTVQPSAALANHLVEAFVRRAAPVKAVLMDQRILAGLGNIYVCEALHRAGIHPASAARSLTVEEIGVLAKAIGVVLAEAIAAGGSTLRDYAQPNGDLGYFSHQWRVYGRAGQMCLVPGCCQIILRDRQGGRSTYWCPGCQVSSQA